MKIFILLFVVVPAIEIGGFLLVGNTIGIWPTLLLIIVTGILGAYLARRQGMKALYHVQDQLRSGEPPGNAIIDGFCILLGGILLLSPGFFSDIVGFILLLPFTRSFLRPTMIRFIRKWMERGNIFMIR